nr:hypothetical protein [Tanacetum cinerariifolium]
SRSKGVDSVMVSEGMVSREDANDVSICKQGLIEPEVSNGIDINRDNNRSGESTKVKTVIENTDGYKEHDMGDIILREPLCKASYVKARRFDGLITIHNGNDNVTYQMAGLHPIFKHLSNAQCNKIKPLLKGSLYIVSKFLDSTY